MFVRAFEVQQITDNLKDVTNRLISVCDGTIIPIPTES